MNGETSMNEPPTFFANVVTMNLNADELVMEFRRFMVAHRDFLKAGEGIQLVKPPMPEDVFKVDPVVRVVLSFSAVRSMKQYLDQALPQIEHLRRSQEQP